MLSWLTRRSADPRAQIRETLGGYELPSFPGVVLSALARLRDPKASSSDIADEVMRDPGITTRLLQMANSPAYALRRPVRNVDHAISLLGRSEVECLLLAVAVQKQVKTKGVSSLDGKRFWHAAARRATFARALADRLHPAARSESFTAALLQDMAVPVLARSKGDPYADVLRQWRGGEGDLPALEAEAIGVDHATVAQWMCESWAFPTQLTEAIACHHGGVQGGLAAVSLVGFLGEDDEHGVERLVETCRDDYALAPDDVLDLLDAAREQATELGAKMGA